MVGRHNLGVVTLNFIQRDDAEFIFFPSRRPRRTMPMGYFRELTAGELFIAVPNAFEDL